MTDRAANHQPDAPRARIRPECIPAVFLPGGCLWPWCAKAYGKLSARDLLALQARPPVAGTEPEIVKNPGTEPEPPTHHPAPSSPADHRPWNPALVKNRLRSGSSSSTGNTTSPWTTGVSDAEYIVVHEVSLKFPEAYAYIIRRICERSGVPVPDTLRPSGAAEEPTCSC